MEHDGTAILNQVAWWCWAAKHFMFLTCSVESGYPGAAPSPAFPQWIQSFQEGPGTKVPTASNSQRLDEFRTNLCHGNSVRFVVGINGSRPFYFWTHRSPFQPLKVVWHQNWLLDWKFGPEGRCIWESYAFPLGLQPNHRQCWLGQLFQEGWTCWFFSGHQEFGLVYFCASCHRIARRLSHGGYSNYVCPPASMIFTSGPHWIWWWTMTSSD